MNVDMDVYGLWVYVSRIVPVEMWLGYVYNKSGLMRLSLL